MKKLLLAAAISAVLSAPAFATNGIAPVGIGQSAKGSGGAGVAYPQDTLAAAINPAGMVHIGNRMDIGIEIFSPDREFTTMGMTFDGNNPKSFFIPEFGYNYMINDRTAVGISVFGNGGMNANYDYHPLVDGFACQQQQLAPPCGLGKAKIDLAQMFIVPTWSYKLNDKNSIGISPIFAIQSFELINAAFASPAPSPGHEITYGFGARIGWMGQVTDRITLGASYQTKISMSEMDDYAQSIQGGSIDIPQNVTFGVAFKASDKLDILADAYWIDYEGADPIGIPTFDPTNPSSFPGGFGWKSIWVAKLGAVYKYTDDLTLRGGLSVGEDPLPSGNPIDGFANTIVPGTTTTHLTLGMTKKVKDDFSITGSFIWSFSEDKTTPAYPAFRIPEITASMQQWALGVSANWNF